MKFWKRLFVLILSVSLLGGAVPVVTNAAKDNETIIYEFLREDLELNVAAACGILANIYAESSFNPTSHNKNDSGGTQSFGICQWNNGSRAGNRFGKLMDWCEEQGYDYRSLEGQLQFMKYELQEGQSYDYYKYDRLKNEIENSAEGAYEASKEWSTFYEGCASMYHEPRAEMARDTYWGKYEEDVIRIVSQPKNDYAFLGENARVAVGVTGNDITYKWYFKNKDASEFSYTSSYKGPTYSIKMTEERAGRQVYCAIEDKYGYTLYTDPVVLDYAIDLKILEQPASVSSYEGETAKIEVQAEGNELNYQWYYKNDGASKFSYTSTFQGPSYYVKMNEERADRQVYCVITDERGNQVKTNTVTLGMKETVEITTQPKSVKVAAGDVAKITVKAEGDGLTYKWYYKNEEASKFSYTKSFKGPSYYLEMTDTRAGRQIYCVITDEYGNQVQTDTVTLEMEEEAKIISQPKSVSVKRGAQAKVTVEAEGDGLTYKWYYKNPGDSKFSYTKSFKKSSYYVEMTKARSGRQVYCVITDAYGNSVKTNTVTLKMK